MLWLSLTGNAESVASSSSTAPATCPARIFNYITESLPNQCLKTPWPSSTNGAKLSQQVIVEGRDGIFTKADEASATAILAPENATKPTASGSMGHPAAPVEPSITTPPNAPDPPIAAEPNQPSSIKATDSESEGESPLDNANFLSFEEWKKQNLAKAGQSPDHVGSGRAGIGEAELRRRPGGINNAFDSLGEDTEIDIDFGGFVDQATIAKAEPAKQAGQDDESSRGPDTTDSSARLGDLSRPHARSKDAGKTCKERSNYASFDCAATVLKTNPECKGSTSVLVENKDSYLLNECSAKNKFLIVELCNDILVDTVVLANFEFFSSMFRTFKVSVSDRYPAKLDKWRELGTFEARNSRQVQAFLVENPLIWARYLRIEFLTHFGNEFYCPVSLLRVHGTTMMEEFNHELKGSRAEEDPEGDIEGAEKDDGKATDVVTAENMKPEWTSGTSKTSDVVSLTSTLSEASLPVPTAQFNGSPASQPPIAAESGHSPVAPQFRTGMELIFLPNGSYTAICKPEESPKSRTSSTFSSRSTQPIATEYDDQHTAAVPNIVNGTIITQRTDSSTSVSSSSSAIENSTVSKTKPSIDSRGMHTSAIDPSQMSLRSPSSSVKMFSSTTQPPSSHPTTQESFFKSVHKRLQLLESNSTLSLQYIEEQSRILRDAFAKVEKRQLAKTNTFLEALNNTVLSEMRDFRQQYDQLWQSTVIELSSQRMQNQHEISALSSRLTMLAEEVVFQKRIAILQFALILVCLGLVLFSRSSASASAFLEMPPVVQHAFNKSSSSLSKYTPQLESPPASPSSTRPPSHYGIFGGSSPSHGRGPSDGSGVSDNEGVKTPNIEYSPPTPTSQTSSEITPSNGIENGIKHALSRGHRHLGGSPIAPSVDRDKDSEGLNGVNHLGLE